MRFIALLKNAKFRSRVLLIGAVVLVFLLTVILGFFCIKAAVKKSDLPQPPPDLPPREEGRAETDVPAAGEELPDLAETIARLSRETAETDRDREIFVEDFWRWIFGEAGLPERLSRKVAASALESPAFIMELLQLLQQDPYMYFLVDKQHPLPDGYEPEDLVPLEEGAYRLGRDGLSLRKAAAASLGEMAAAAAADGITLTVGSTYRSAAYQAQVYEREVKTYGRETADRESAQPGKSQHQLGLVADFSPIDDAFAETPASAWLIKNAGRFGWALSFPDGYEEVTGYRFESWHYRYVGRDTRVFIDTYFEGIQQYALQFIHAWLESSAAESGL